MINGSATDGVAAVATQHVASMFNLVLFNIVMIINVMFTIEMLLRIVSQGFYGPATARPVPPSRLSSTHARLASFHQIVRCPTKGRYQVFVVP